MKSQEPAISRLLTLAAGQHNVVTRDQLQEVGLAASAIRGLVGQGWLRRIRRGAYSVGGTPASAWQPAVAAALVAGPGSAISHSTAAAMHLFPHLVHGQKVEITVERPRHPNVPGVVVHWVSDPLPPDVTVTGGVTITTPSRTLIDISKRLPGELLARIVDEGCVTGLWTVERLSRGVESRRSRGRERPRALEAVLAERVLVPAGNSWLERRVIDLLQPYFPFEVQYQLVLEGKVVILDIAWPRWRVAVESDGFAAHGRSRSNFDRDRRRSNLLAAHGWIVIHVTSAMSDDEIIAAVGRVLPPTG